MEWFSVNTERFDSERNRAVFARFVLKAANIDDASLALELYLAEPCEGTVATAWKPKTIREMLDVPETGINTTKHVSSAESAFFNSSFGNHVRLMEYREYEPAD